MERKKSYAGGFINGFAILLAMVVLLPAVSMGQQSGGVSKKLQQLHQQFLQQHHIKNKAGDDGAGSSQAYGVNYNSIPEGYTVFEPDQSWNHNPNTNTKYNFGMFRQGRPAGDINGDGKDDYIVAGVGRDERTTPLEDQIGKTAVYFGGNTSNTPDQFVYANLVTVGDLNGDGYDDAVKKYQNLRFPSSLIQYGSSSYVIYKGSASGYQRTSKILYHGNYTEYGFTDLDKDGKDDLLAYNSSYAYVFWGNNPLDYISSNGQSIYGLASGSRKLAAGDVDQDSLEEIVELSGYSGSGQITIMQVDTASRAITQQQSFAFNDLKYNADQSGLNLIDINGNGYPEIYIDTDSLGAKYVFTYDTVAQQYSTTPIQFFNGDLVPAGDLNGDGNTDFIQGDSTDSYYPYISYGPNDLTTKPQLDFKLNGNSSTEWHWHMDYNPYGSFGDFDGDGIDDALMGHTEWSAGNTTKSRRILSGNTSGSYNSTFVQYDFNNYYSEVYETQEIGDINEDGIDDFVISLFDQQKLEIFYGDTTISQTPDMTINLNTSPAFVTSGDFNGDGKVDLGVLGFKNSKSGSSTINLFWGGASMDATADYTVSASDFQSADYTDLLGLHNVGDVNNDGIDDFLAGSSSAYDSVATDSASFLNEAYLFYGGSSISQTPDQTISLTSRTAYYTWAGEMATALGDINGDGVDDFAISEAQKDNGDGSSGQVQVYYGGSGKTFSSPDMVLKPESQNRGFGWGIAAGDFNGDGNTDIAVSAVSYYSGETNDPTAIQLYYGGTGFDNMTDKFLKLPRIKVEVNSYEGGYTVYKSGYAYYNYGTLSVIPDFTNDGKDELLFTSSEATNSAALYTFNNSDSSEPSTILEGPNKATGLGGFVNVAVGDFNNDGQQDVVATQRSDDNDAFRSSRIYRYALPSPLTMTSVEDVPDDQGGWIRIHVGGYLMDAMSKDIYGFDSWGVWRMTADSSWTNVATVQPYSGGAHYVDVHVPKTQPSGVDSIDLSYKFKVTAYNADYGNNGIIAQTGIKSGKAFDNVAPGQVQGLTVQGQTAAKIKSKSVSRTLSWNTVDANDISEYDIYAVQDDGTLADTTVGSSTSTNFALPDAFAGVQNFVVKARDDHNNYGKASSPASAIYPKSIQYQENKGWNLVSFPMVADFGVLTQQVKDSTSAPVYEYGGSYQKVDQLQAGKGYWIKLSSDKQFEITNLPATKLSLNLHKGWNLISGVGGDLPLSDISDPDGIVINGTAYAFDQAYTSSDTLRPGMGYWLRTSQAGTVTLTHPKLVTNKAKTKRKESDTFAEKSADIEKTFGKITISDGKHSSKLYFGGELPKGVNKLSYSMPPLPPGNTFDARYKGNMRLVENDEMYIKVSNPDKDPLKLKIDVQSMAEYNKFVVKEFAGGKLLSQYKVDANKETELQHSNTDAIYVAPAGGQVAQQETPTEFDLKQNYPNPFNPTTQIRYSVAKTAPVKLEIFNILGKRVATLVNKEQKPGRYKVTFDGSHLASGMYLYRLRAGNHVITKKLILAK